MAGLGRQLRHSFATAVRPLTARLPGRRGVAFVLSGGGALGAVQVGMLRALVEAGIRPDLVIGCSVGAINGAGFAADPTLRGVARLERIWRRLAEGDPELMPSSLVPVAVQLGRRGPGIHDMEPLARLLDEELPVHDFEHLPIPFQCVATDVELAVERWFERGPLLDALLASAALPAVYPSRWIDGREYVDGGVLNEINTDRAVALGMTDLYVLHVGHLDKPPRIINRPFDGALRAYWIHRRYRYEEDLRRIPEFCTVHRLPAGSAEGLRFDHFSRAPELTEQAYRHTSAYLRAVSPHSPATDATAPTDAGPGDGPGTESAPRRDGTASGHEPDLTGPSGSAPASGGGDDGEGDHPLSEYPPSP